MTALTSRASLGATQPSPPRRTSPQDPSGRIVTISHHLWEKSHMPLSSTPPSGPVTLSSNARTVLEKRYLVKDRTGKPTERGRKLALTTRSFTRPRNASS